MEWFKVRDEYLVSAVARSQRYEKKNVDQRVFPFENNTAYFFWRNALVKTKNGGRDTVTKRYCMHPHVLRKYFRTKLGLVIPIDVVEARMGHEGYLTEVYRKYSVEDLAKIYKEGEHSLLVFTEAAEVSKLKAKVEARYQDLEGQRNYLMNRVMEQDAKINNLEARINKTDALLNKILEKLEPEG